MAEDGLLPGGRITLGVGDRRLMLDPGRVRLGPMLPRHFGLRTVQFYYVLSFIDLGTFKKDFNKIH